MAIGDIYNSLTFGEVNSLDYGIYVSGPGVFDAPTRDIEFVTVPGRNGDIEIDKGHWNNIEVTYKAGTFGDDQSDFATKINAFRNAIVSQIGYQKITDTYNPEEYRLGIYSSGLSVDPVNRNSAGEFDLVFNCKPQRYLVEGEEEVLVTSGEVVTNPTLYDAGPLLMVKGYGDIRIGQNLIRINNDKYGIIEVARPQSGDTIILDTDLLEDGDEIFFLRSLGYTVVLDYVLSTIDGYVFRDSSEKPPGFINSYYKTFEKTERTDLYVYNYGTSKSDPLINTNPSKILSLYTASGTRLGSTIVSPSVAASYDGDKTITLQSSVYRSGQTDYYNVSEPIYQIVPIYANSTKDVLGDVTYIDLEVGDAYKMEDGRVYDLNKYIELPSDLPRLVSGETEITFDNTISELKIIPRWWTL